MGIKRNRECNIVNMHAILCRAMMDGWSDYVLIAASTCFLFAFLLLPIYWYALSFEDFHQWSARLKI